MKLEIKTGIESLNYLPWGNCNHTAANFVATWLHWLKREWFESFQTGCLHCPVSLATHLARRFSFHVCDCLVLFVAHSHDVRSAMNLRVRSFTLCIGSPARSFLSHQIDFIHKLNQNQQIYHEMTFLQTLAAQMYAFLCILSSWPRSAPVSPRRALKNPMWRLRESYGRVLTS